MAPPRALRLSFSYRWPELQLESIREVDMRPLPGDPVERAKDESGFWYELRNESGQALYRRIAQNPMRTSAEVLIDDPDRPLAREELTEVTGRFTVVMPNVPDAATVALLGTAPGRELRGPAEELASFDLRSRRRIS